MSFSRPSTLSATPPQSQASGLSVGDLIMARRQLLNLKLLAERHQH
jgi:hypothetical protein